MISTEGLLVEMPCRLIADVSQHARAFDMATTLAKTKAYDEHDLAVAERARSQVVTIDGGMYQSASTSRSVRGCSDYRCPAHRRRRARARDCLETPPIAQAHRPTVAPGNAGTEAIAHNIDLPLPKTGADASFVEPYLEAATRLARDLKVDLVFVAPDDPLSWGLVDRLEAAGIPAFGPSQAAAQIEASKAWAADFVRRHGIPHPWTAGFSDNRAARAFVREQTAQLVVKASGLAAGKGAIVTSTTEEALAALDSLMESRSVGDAGSTVVVMERLFCRETSAHAFSDGKTYRAHAIFLHHKAVFDGDLGPNTGGMGVYSPPSWIAASGRTNSASASHLGRIGQGNELPKAGPIAASSTLPASWSTEPALKSSRCNAASATSRPRPSCRACELRSVSTSLWACVNGKLHEVDVRWSAKLRSAWRSPQAATPELHDWPADLQASTQLDSDVVVFHAGTRRMRWRLLTTGGRVLNVVATREDARRGTRAKPTPTSSASISRACITAATSARRRRPASVFKHNSEAKVVELFPGVVVNRNSGDNATLVEITLVKGASVPMHNHPHEQNGYVDQWARPLPHR